MIDKLFMMMKEYRREIVNNRILNGGNDVKGSAASFFAMRDYKSNNNVQTLLHEINGISRRGGLTQEEYNRFEQRISKMTDTNGENMSVAELWREYKNYTSLMDKNSPFYKSPKYNVEKPKGWRKAKTLEEMMDLAKNANNNERKNMFIELAKQIMRTTEASKINKNPATYDNSKHAAKVANIKKNKEVLQAFIREKNVDLNKPGDLTRAFNSMNIKELEAFYLQHNINSNPYGFSEYLANYKNLMDGKELISILAVNSSMHYKLQAHPLSLAQPVQFKIKNKDGKLVTISQVDLKFSPVSGRLVGSIIAELQTASPDNGKDPVLGDLGINPLTANFVGYLGRLGIENDQLGIINTFAQSAGFGALKKSLSNENYEIDSSFYIDTDKISELHAKLTLREAVNKEESEKKDKTVYNKYSDTFTAEEMKYLGQLMRWYDIQKKASEDLNAFSTVGRSDSTSGALSYNTAGVIQQMIQYEQYRRKLQDPTFSIIGLEKVLDTEMLDPTLGALSQNIDDIREKIKNSPIGHLQADFTLGNELGAMTASELIPEVSKETIDIITELSEALPNGGNLGFSKNLANLQKMLNALMNYKQSKFNFMRGKNLMERRNYYIHDFPMKYVAFLAARPKMEKRFPVLRAITVKSGKPIKFINIGGIKEGTRQAFQNQMLMMLADKNKDIRQFAMDLFMYSLYSDGLNFGPSSLSILFTTSFLDGIKNDTNNYNSDLMKANKVSMEAKVPGTDITNRENFIRQFLINNRHMLPAAKIDKKAGMELVDEFEQKYGKNKKRKVPRQIVINQTDFNDALFRKQNVLNSNNQLYKMIKFRGNTFSLSQNENGQWVYNLMEEVPTSMYYDGSTAYYDIAYNELKSRGNITKLTSTQKKDLKAKAEDSKMGNSENNQGNENPTENEFIPSNTQEQMTPDTVAEEEVPNIVIDENAEATRSNAQDDTITVGGHTISVSKINPTEKVGGDNIQDARDDASNIRDIDKKLAEMGNDINDIKKEANKKQNLDKFEKENGGKKC
jgi:hypothetical protein